MLEPWTQMKEDIVNIGQVLPLWGIGINFVDFLQNEFFAFDQILAMQISTKLKSVPSGTKSL